MSETLEQAVLRIAGETDAHFVCAPTIHSRFHEEWWDQFAHRLAEWMAEGQEPCGTLHDDGYFSWNRKKHIVEPYMANFAGWKQPFYLHPTTLPELQKAAEKLGMVMVPKAKADLQKEAEFEVWQNDEMVASASGPRDEHLREIDALTSENELQAAENAKLKDHLKVAYHYARYYNDERSDHHEWQSPRLKAALASIAETLGERA